MGNSNGGIGRQSATGQSIRSSTSAHSGAQMLGQLQQLEPVPSLATTAFNSSQTLPRARQRAAVGATSSASSSTSVVVVEGQQNIVVNLIFILKIYLNFIFLTSIYLATSCFLSSFYRNFAAIIYSTTTKFNSVRSFPCRYASTFHRSNTWIYNT